jgi:tetratricopeptide (TPR) repeat protein
MPDLLKQGLEAYRQGSMDSASGKYQAALQQDAKSGEAYAGLARVYLKQEKGQLAFETAGKGLAAAPDCLAAHTAMGEVYFRLARMVEAEKEFLVGVNAPHPDARALLGLSRLYNAYSLHARAKRMLDRAHDVDPSDPDIEKRWMGNLDRVARIRWLEAHLSAQNNDDSDTREGLHTYLDLLKAREKRADLSCRLVSKLTSTETKLHPMMVDATHLHGYGLDVKVNGQSSRLLLDTGASGFFINKRLAKKAGVEPLVTTKLGGIGDKGDIEGYTGVAETIKIGDLEFHNCLVEVSDKRSVLGDDGLIGADIFGHYLVTIDFLWQKLKLEELPKRPGEKEADISLDTEDNGGASDSTPAAKDAADAKSAPKLAAAFTGPQDRYIAPEMQNYTRVFRFGHDLLIPTRVGDTPSKLFLIDTGAMFNSISPDAAREVTKVHNDSDTRVHGISGAVKNVYSADKAVLVFSHYRQENQDLTTFDLSKISRSDGTEISGILGFATLRLFILKIDYRDGLVDFVYAGPKQ